MAMLWNLLQCCVATALIWKASDRLEQACERLAKHYRLPDIVTGAVLTAVGSSFPELSSVILATLVHGKFDLGIASIVGSAIFNILVIPAAAVLFGQGKLDADKTLVYKEAQFYLISVAVFLHAVSFAVIYYPADTEDIQGDFTRPLALIPVALYAVYIFTQYHDTREHQNETEATTDDVSPLREWIALVLSMAVVALGVEILIRAAIALGEIFESPSSLWGLTVIAAGTSLPDLFISVKASRAGKSVTSLSNVFGSNTFDLLIAVPTGVLLGGAVLVNFTHAVPMMGCLTIATIVAFVFLRQDLSLSRKEAVAMLVLYVAFVALVTLETLGVTRLFWS